MEQTQNFIPVLFEILLILLALSSPVFYIRLRRAKKAALAKSEKAEKDLEELKENCCAELKNTQDEANQRAETTLAEHNEALERYAAIDDMEAEIERLKALGQNQVDEAQSKVAKLNGEARATQDNIRGLRKSYKEKRVIYDRLKSELAIFDERLALAELGVNEPHFDFGDSETFKAAIIDSARRKASSARSQGGTKRRRSLPAAIGKSAG